MSIKKIALGFALAGMLGATAAVAEEEGSFVGGQISSGWVSATYKIDGPTADGSRLNASYTITGKSGTRLGIVFGKYYSIDEDMGYRMYSFADLGESIYNINANADFLYSLPFKFEKLEIRLFAGAYVGAVLAPGLENPVDRKSFDEKEFFWGIDAGMNLGTRFVIAKRHGIELYYRYGFLSPESTTEYESRYGDGKIKSTWKFQQSSSGIRYTFSF